MDDALKAIKEVQKSPTNGGKKLDELVRNIQSKRYAAGLSKAAVFFGIAKGMEKIVENEIYFGTCRLIHESLSFRSLLTADFTGFNIN